MNSFDWIPWLLVICICMTEARYKMRRPLPPSPLPPPQLYKKSWPISHRMSMGNTIHIGNNYSPKRPIFNKPSHYRLRPPPMFNVPPTQWKNPIPVISPIQNIAVIPQRAPVKEFTVMKKVPEYSPEYHPELIALPQTHRGDIDDDRGPIHTIPAPNLSLADKPYHTGEENNDDNTQGGYRRFPTDNEYNSNGSGAVATNYGFGGSGISAEYQRPVTNPTPSQNSYEVTKMHDVTNEFQTVVPTFFPAGFDSSRIVSSGPTPDVQTNELYLNHPPISRSGIIDTNIKFGHSNVPMQTNLHSSLHVGFPSSEAQAPSLTPSQMSDIHVGHQASDLHVGHPAASGPPLSADQLYDLLNSFPQPLVEQYTTDQQPQLQQHLLQQQLNQLTQSETNPTTFSQPQMHSFNYDEQAAKQQHQQQLQQQILFGQDYASGRVTADYNLAPEPPLDVHHNVDIHQNQETGYQSENSEQADNNIEYDEQGSSNTVNQAGSENYFRTVGNDGVGMSAQFYTTLPNRETAEKLAALAAAGNVNSHLIDQLKKQQQKQQEQEQEQQMQQHQQQDEQKFNDENLQNDEPMKANHNYQVEEQIDDIPHEEQKENLQQPQRLRYGSQKRYRQRYRQQQIQQEQEAADKHYEQQKFMQEQREQEEEQKNQEQRRPLRIMVPEVDDDVNYRNSHSSDSTNDDYEYDNTDSQSTEVNTTLSRDDSTSEFGSRIKIKSDM